MPDFQLNIQKEHEEYSVGELIAKNFKISSRMLTKLKNNDGIKLNGEHITVRGRVKEGDVLSLVFPREKSKNVVPIELPLNILYEDDELLIVNKPKDMPVHPSLNNYTNTLGNAVMYYYKDIPFVYRPVNRLDRDTTGIVIISKSAYSHNHLSKQMQKNLFKKTYTAVTVSPPIPAKGIINAPIKREQESIIKRVVAPDGQTAVTEYETLYEKDGKGVVKVLLHTGRTHQIRVHFSHIGFPLLYDYLYGTEVEGKTFMLHCTELEFLHPITEKPLKITCEPEFIL